MSDSISTEKENKFVAKCKELIKNFGWPRIIIALFLVVLFIIAPFVKVSIAASISDIFNRFGMNALLVLAMVPMIQSGCGLNFGLSLGVIAGLLGSTIAMQIGLTSWGGIFGAMLLSPCPSRLLTECVESGKMPCLRFASLLLARVSA